MRTAKVTISCVVEIPQAMFDEAENHNDDESYYDRLRITFFDQLEDLLTNHLIEAEIEDHILDNGDRF